MEELINQLSAKVGIDKETAAKVADFLILNRRCPRSLFTSIEGAHNNLLALQQEYGKSTPAQMRASSMIHDFNQLTVEQVFDEGMHEFLTRFIRENSGLASLVSEAYLSGEAR